MLVDPNRFRRLAALSEDLITKLPKRNYQMIQHVSIGPGVALHVGVAVEHSAHNFLEQHLEPKSQDCRGIDTFAAGDEG